MRSRIAVYTLFIFLAFSVIAPVSGLRVDNSILQSNVTPGEHIRHEMRVMLSENESAIDAQAEIMGMGTTINGDNIVPLNGEDDRSSFSARDFFEVSPASFTLEPGKPISVILEGDVPGDVGPGGRYAMVYFHTAPQGNETIGFTTAIIVPIYLTINGTDILRTGEIASVEVSNDGVLSGSFENTGNHYIRLSVEALLKDEDGNVVRNVSSQRVTSLPSIPIIFGINLDPDSDLSSGQYVVEVKMVSKDGTILDSEDKTFEVR